MSTKTNMIRNLALAMLVAFTFVCCSSDPEWADPEAHEKTEQLQKIYSPLMVGTWHYEKISDKQRFFEQLTFYDDGTLKGLRKWQSRKLVTVDGVQQYTDWENVEPLEGAFTGSWSLLYWSPDGREKRNCLQLYATYDNVDREYMAYSFAADFAFADATTLCFQGCYVSDGDGRARYLRGEEEPNF